jgi:uncharacterized protein (TIGR02453 family)
MLINPVHTPVIHPSTLKFLQELSSHNNREWFNEHKRQYELAKENVEQFLDGLIGRMNEHDQLETLSGKKSLYRIHNDLRFSPEKAPYNPRFAAYLKRTKPFLRGGYYLWIKPGGSRVGCGFAAPNAMDLKRIREDIVANHPAWRQLLALEALKKTFGSMSGERVKTAPRGFSNDDPAIDLLRYKQFWFEHAFTDEEATAPDFLLQIDETFRVIRPFFDHLSEVLTTDGNGESLY